MCSVEIMLADELSNAALAQLRHLFDAVDVRASIMRTERTGDDW